VAVRLVKPVLRSSTFGNDKATMRNNTNLSSRNHEVKTLVTLAWIVPLARRNILGGFLVFV
jgi:hypothetical protein